MIKMNKNRKIIKTILLSEVKEYIK
jgi:hypothetical protein